MAWTERRWWHYVNLFKWCDGDSLSPAEWTLNRMASSSSIHYYFCSFWIHTMNLRTSTTTSTLSYRQRAYCLSVQVFHFVVVAVVWAKVRCNTTNSWRFSFRTKHQPHTVTHMGNITQGKLLSVASQKPDCLQASYASDHIVYLILAHRLRKYLRTHVQEPKPRTRQQIDGKLFAIALSDMPRERARNTIHLNFFVEIVVVCRLVVVEICIHYTLCVYCILYIHIFIQGFELHVARTKIE